MKIMILGANGFIGRRILKRLAPKHQVMACSLHQDILPEESYRFEVIDGKLTPQDANNHCFDALRYAYRYHAITVGA